MVSYVFLPQDVFCPEEASKERMSDAHILRGEVGELVFIGSSWLSINLNVGSGG
jgi:hypothetical protein